MSIQNLQLVILDRPVDTWQDPQTRELFSKLISLRLSGYGAEHPATVVPLDTFDFTATHAIFCDTSQGELNPVMCYRFVMQDQARYHRYDFPGMPIVRSSKATAHERILSQILKRCETEQKRVAYVGSWTIHPTIRKDRALTTLLRDLTIGTHALLQEEYNVPEAVLCGSLRFKTHLFQMRIGYSLFQENGTELPPFRQYSLADEEVVMLHLERPSEEANRLASEYRSFWAQRITIEKEKSEQQIAA